MYQSVAKQQLLKLLKGAKTRAERAELATRLANLEDKESRTKARKDRAKRRKAEAAKKAAPAPKPDDGNEEFVLEGPTLTGLELEAKLNAMKAQTPEEKAREEKARRILFDIPEPPKPEPPRDYAAECIARQRERQTGFTRVMNGMEANEYWDAEGRHFIWDASIGTYRQNWPEQIHTQQIVPQSDVLDSDTYSNARGWESEAKAEEQGVEDRLFQEYLDKIAGK